jgi:putative ABC transport system permease protein
MRRSPGFTTVACVTLALGIGANTAIFSLVNVLVWRDLPVRDPERLVQFTWQYPGDPPLHFFGTEQYEQFRDRNDVFSDLIGTGPISLAPTLGEAPLHTEWVTGNYFEALGVRPALGRLLKPVDGAPGASPVAVVSWTFWKNRFNLDPGSWALRSPSPACLRAGSALSRESLHKSSASRGRNSPAC